MLHCASQIFSRQDRFLPGNPAVHQRLADRGGFAG
jgi:hypothetical protein